MASYYERVAPNVLSGRLRILAVGNREFRTVLLSRLDGIVPRPANWNPGGVEHDRRVRLLYGGRFDSLRRACRDALLVPEHKHLFLDRRVSGDRGLLPGGAKLPDALRRRMRSVDDPMRRQRRRNVRRERAVGFRHGVYEPNVCRRWLRRRLHPGAWRVHRWGHRGLQR